MAACGGQEASRGERGGGHALYPWRLSVWDCVGLQGSLPGGIRLQRIPSSWLEPALLSAPAKPLAEEWADSAPRTSLKISCGRVLSRGRSQVAVTSRSSKQQQPCGSRTMQHTAVASLDLRAGTPRRVAHRHSDPLDPLDP